MAASRIVPVPPHWFAAVMGTSIIATAAHGLPVRAPGLDTIAWAAWGLAGGVLVATVAGTLTHLLRDRGALREYVLDPEVAPIYGAPAMALLAFGTATLLVAEPILGLSAVVIDAFLWCAGTALGLATAVGVTLLSFARHAREVDAVAGTWLMAVVPPMVSAAGGALLLPHLEGAAAQTLALACYAMAGAAGLAALLVTGHLWSRLVHHPLGAAATVPALWLVLGPLGQGATAIGLLADHAGPPLGIDPGLLRAASVLTGLPLLGFALLWLAIVVALTARAVRAGLPFTLGWWAFTFPVGTLVTAATSLTQHTGADAMSALAATLFVLLLAGWAAAATGTMRSLYPAVSSRFIRATHPGPWYTKAV